MLAATINFVISHPVMSVQSMRAAPILLIRIRNSILLAIATLSPYSAPMRSSIETIAARPPRRWARILLAGPGAILVTLTLLAGMPLWLPGGAAGGGNLAFPLGFGPLIWAILFFHACLDRSLMRVALVAGMLFLVHGGMVASRFMGNATAVEPVR